ncbi:hypothetical protein DSL92_05085 [Billgrantia gudaonensis]|uniref:Uncharacterized protein n=1 Tax=Billgrantia gudaonensis TaxID=376427 RepID=A0A3S0R522_9GAMM|nr:hypothetical protein DSL92_05085 [Halomonas gudaonensis]
MAWLVPWALLGLPLARGWQRLDALALGDDMATGWERPCPGTRLSLLLLAVALSGAAVAFAGGLISSVCSLRASRVAWWRGHTTLVPTSP